jgi:hypothetical protein
MRWVVGVYIGRSDDSVMLVLLGCDMGNLDISLLGSLVPVDLELDDVERRCEMLRWALVKARSDWRLALADFNLLTVTLRLSDGISAAL